MINTVGEESPVDRRRPDGGLVQGILFRTMFPPTFGSNVFVPAQTLPG